MNWWVAPAGVGADQDRLLLACLLGELGERQVDHVDLVGGGIGRSVARPQDRGQRLAGAVATVQPGRQRMKPEPTPVGPSRALLVGVRGHQGGIQVDHQQPSTQAPACQARRRARARASRSPASPCSPAPASRSMTRQAVGVEATWPNSPGWSRSAARSLRQSHHRRA